MEGDSRIGLRQLTRKEWTNPASRFRDEDGFVTRANMQRIDSLNDVVDYLQARDGAHTLIFDVDNTLVRQGAPLEEFQPLVNAAIDRFEAMEAVERVIVLTNGAERGVPRMISRGNKPWTSRRRLGLRGIRTPIVVVGDQVLTDGLLAWRLKATHLHLVIDQESEPSRQALMRSLGRFLERVVMRANGAPAGRVRRRRRDKLL